MGVFIVMLMWTLDKFVNPEHAARVFAGFYGIAETGSVMLIIGLGELVLVIAFVIGWKKRWTYGRARTARHLDLLQLRSVPATLDNLLFFAAWPMLASCIALYLLREQDTLLTIGVPRVLVTD
ncbi:MAG: hypothetical protein U5K33_09770 [Halofilum sp. (in: g-proteobacteria)]|nr:hypothetical protein [Halofilum sp. (in: g-proteobacteria)]